MASIQRLLDEMKDVLMVDEDDDKNLKVTKALPSTKEEQKIWSEMNNKTDAAFKLLKETAVDRERFWAKVQLRLDAFGKNLSYNKNTKEIEFKEPVN